MNYNESKIVSEIDRKTLFVAKKDRVCRIVPGLRQKEARDRTATASNLQKKWVCTNQ